MEVQSKQITFTKHLVRALNFCLFVYCEKSESILKWCSLSPFQLGAMQEIELREAAKLYEHKLVHVKSCAARVAERYKK